MVYCLDIDGTICNAVQVSEYGNSKPYIDRIRKVNLLYNEGHTIIFHTGRHWNDLNITLTQLEKWGVKYHALVMGKPVADVYIDDRAIDDISFFERQNG